MPFRVAAAFALTCLFPMDRLAAQSPVPHWLWSHSGEIGAQEQAWIWQTFELPQVPRKARLHLAADNGATLWLGGEFIGTASAWEEASVWDVTDKLRPGANVVAIAAQNRGGPAAVLFAIFDGAEKPALASGSSALAAREAPAGWPLPNDSSGVAVTVLGPLGQSPWGPIRLSPPPDHWTLPPGFRVDEAASGVGSLIALTLTPSGGVLVSVENGGLVHLEDRDGDGRFETRTPVASTVRNAHGLLCAHDSLYVVGEDQTGMSLFRMTWPGATEVRSLVKFTGSPGEHAAHGILLGRSGELLVAVGNHVQPEAVSADSPYRLAYEGSALPVVEDTNGHAVGIRAPGGTVIAVDPKTGSVRRLAGGLRNAYDLAFSRGGDLLAFDSDMEWEIGLPWHRPVRLVHIVPGGEYGWRSGSKKWPAWSPDSLPPIVEVGRGSPTGMVLYDRAAFPSRYRGAVFGADWSEGRIVAFHLERDGHGLKGRAENFMTGRPLPVTDLAVDARGDLLLTTGGRGTRGRLLRVSYEGPSDDGLGTPLPPPPTRPVPTGPDALLADLGSPDRTLRFLAARDLESMPITTVWRTLRGAPLRIASEGLLALIRQHGLSAWKLDGVEAVLLRTLQFEAVGSPAWHAAVRAVELAVIAGAAVSPALSSALLRPTLHPEGDFALSAIWASLDPRLSRMLLADSLRREPNVERQIHYLRGLAQGTSPLDMDTGELIATTLAAAAVRPGGASYLGHLRALQERILPRIRKEARHQVAKALDPAARAAIVLDPKAERRPLDRTLAFVERRLQTPRSEEAGRALFKSSCGACHRLGDIGQNGGPELTSARGRFTVEDFLIATLLPSRTISDQYRSIDHWLKDGSVVSGLPVGETTTSIRVLAPTGLELEVAKAEIEERKPSAGSAMPDGLLDGLSLEQVTDLTAFVLGVADPREPARPWRSLLDERLSQFEGESQYWSFEASTLVGDAKDLKRNTFLVSKEAYRDFRLEFEVRLDAGNSGMQFRSQRLPNFDLQGYQADVGEAYWGSIYDEHGRGTLVPADPTVWKPAVAPLDWNHYLILAEGDLLEVYVNGVLTSAIKDDRYASGHFGLQLHSGARTRVLVRHLRITGAPQ